MGVILSWKLLGEHTLKMVELFTNVGVVAMIITTYQWDNEFYTMHIVQVNNFH